MLILILCTYNHIHNEPQENGGLAGPWRSLPFPPFLHGFPEEGRQCLVLGLRQERRARARLRVQLFAASDDKKRELRGHRLEEVAICGHNAGGQAADVGQEPKRAAGPQPAQPQRADPAVGRVQGEDRAGQLRLPAHVRHNREGRGVRVGAGAEEGQI